MKRLFYYCFLFPALLVGCIYEYPDDEASLDPAMVELTVTLALNIGFEMETGVEQFVQTHESLFAEGYAIRYIVDLYQWPDLSEAPLSQRVRRLITTEAAMPADGIYRFSEAVTLPASRYYALVWVDFVPKGSLGDFYYHTENLQAVTMVNTLPYRGYHTGKDAFTASVPIDLASSQSQNTRFEATVQVKRPFAFYRIITTDVKKYRDARHGVPYATIRPDITRLLYEAWFPMGYNVYRSVPDNFDNSGVHYTYDMPETDEYDTDVEVASDFVFVSGSATFYFVDFDICTPADVRISRHNGIRINLQRNRMTIISGEFLTTGSSSDGAGVDFEFDEEFVIFL
jgi:hypothetical protein